MITALKQLANFDVVINRVARLRNYTVLARFFARLFSKTYSNFVQCQNRCFPCLITKRNLDKIRTPTSNINKNALSNRNVLTIS